MYMVRLNLQQMIDTELLQNIQDQFGEATGIATVAVDFLGEPLTENSHFTSFCKKVREIPELMDRCRQCDAYGGLESTRQNQPHIYFCHTGLVDFAIPISVKGQFVGSVLAGQAKLSEEEKTELDFITKESNSWRSNEEIVKAYDAIPITTLEKIKAAAQLMHTVVNSMVEKDVINYIQDELNEKNTKLIEQMKAQAALEKDIQEKEITALQPYMNVNFIIHTLNTIVKQSTVEKAMKTRDTTFLLVDFLQYILENSNKLIRIENEKKHIENYLKIQKIRFGKRIKTELHVDPNLNDILIPSLILQAIIDNSIIHGLERKDGEGLVDISIKSKEDHIILQVVDNGVGMTSQKLSEICGETKKHSSMNRITGTDLGMIQNILSYHYGTNFSIGVHSEEGQGTSVVITIPSQREAAIHD